MAQDADALARTGSQPFDLLDSARPFLPSESWTAEAKQSRPIPGLKAVVGAWKVPAPLEAEIATSAARQRQLQRDGVESKTIEALDAQIDRAIAGGDDPSPAATETLGAISLHRDGGSDKATTELDRKAKGAWLLWNRHSRHPLARRFLGVPPLTATQVAQRKQRTTKIALAKRVATLNRTSLIVRRTLGLQARGRESHGARRSSTTRSRRATCSARSSSDSDPPGPSGDSSNRARLASPRLAARRGRW
jgi:hypothetical protein